MTRRDTAHHQVACHVQPATDLPARQRQEVVMNSRNGVTLLAQAARDCQIRIRELEAKTVAHYKSEILAAAKQMNSSNAQPTATDLLKPVDLISKAGITSRRRRASCSRPTKLYVGNAYSSQHSQPVFIPVPEPAAASQARQYRLANTGLGNHTDAPARDSNTIQDGQDAGRDPSRVESEALGSNGATGTRFADVQLDSIIAEADASTGSHRHDRPDAGGHAIDPAKPAGTATPAQGECPINTGQGDDAVLQALRRYRAAAWW
eukprot:jgi/Ulvmu1/8874/UM049_0056.1